MKKLFRQKLLPTSLQVYLLVTLPAYILSEIMARVIVVRPRLQLSQVSALAGMQIWYWLIILILLPFFLLFKIKHNFSKEKIITLILYAGISLNIAFVGAANKLALSKVPLPPGDIRGDNGALLSGMMRAQETGWSGNFYPPVWLSLVGNIARFSGNSVLEIWKPVFLLSVVLLPGLVLLAWRQAFTPLIAAAFTFLFTFVTIEWKSIANLIMTAMFIAIAYRVVFTEKYNSKFDIRIFFYGIFFGLASLTYYGNLWWSLIAIALLVVSLAFYSNREILLLRVFDAGIGFLLIFAPSQVGPRLGLSGLVTILLILILSFLRILLQQQIFFSNVIAYLTILFVPAGVFFTVVTSTTGDEWFYPAMEQNPVPNLGLSFNTQGLLFLFITLVGIIIAFKIKEFKATIVVALTTFISSALMMFWFAAQMEVTGRVELWPRAGATFSFAWQLITLVALFALLTSEYFENFLKSIWPKNLTNFQNLFLTLLLIFPFLVVHARTLSETQDGIFPIGENEVWLAYRACDNPNEDPMLAKVFEEKPFIQDFLRENCPKADWPVIPPINSAE